MDYKDTAEYQNLQLRAARKTSDLSQGTYEIPSMDKAITRKDSPKFFTNTEVVKANDDSASKN